MSIGPDVTALTAQQAQDVQKKMSMDALRQRLTPGPNQQTKLREACEGFESVFLGQMIKEMRKSVPKDGLLHGKYEDQYVSMFDEELSKTLAKQGGVGLADFMRQQLAAREGGASSKEGVASKPGLHVAGSEKTSAPAAEKKASRYMGQRAAVPLSGQLGVATAREAARLAAQEGQTPPAQAQAPQAAATPAAPTQDTAASQAASPAPASPPAQAQPQNQPQAQGGPKLSDPMQIAARAWADAQNGTLDGTPSQHLGLPGAQYLQGADKALAASGLTVPVSGEVTSTFGWRRDPFTGQRAWHSGVDIAAPEGSPVRASADGVVVFAGSRGGYGNLVEVQHADGSHSLYGHNKANAVVEGQAVKAGQVIAQVGQTGRATGPHVHFEIRRDGVAVNPLGQGGAVLAETNTRETAIPDL